MTSDQQPRDDLEKNVRRLFGQLERGGPMPETRDRILERLLRETPGPRPTRAVRRSIRWIGLAATLFVATALLTVTLDDPAGSKTPERNAGPVAAEATGDETLVTFAIHLLAAGPGTGVVEASNASGGEPVHLRPERYVSNADVESAWVEQAESGCQVGVRLTDEGADKLARLTQDHIGDQLALVIDGEVVMTPTIRSKITSLGVLTGDFSDARCGEIASGLSGHR